MMSYLNYKKIQNLERYRSGEISASVADGLATYLREATEKEAAKYDAEKQRLQTELTDYRERNGIDLVKKALSK